MSDIAQQLDLFAVVNGTYKIEKLKSKIDELQKLMDNATSKDEYEKYHCRKANLLCNLNLLEKQDITKGFDYSILDEFVRVMKHIYIYIYGAVKTKYMTL